MKKIYSILAAALLTTGALLTTACSGDDDTVVDNITLRQDSETAPTTGSETIQFTATLAPKDGATTRAITTGTEDGKEILNVAWAAGEEVAVYYQKSSDTYATATATVGEPNADGSASITASLDSPMDGGTVKFVYPASLANEACDDIDESKLLNNQRGFLTYNGWGPDRYSISKFFDAATGSGTLSVSPGKAVTTNRISLTNRCCICKFNLGLVNPHQGVNDYVITITAGSHSYVINMKPGLLSKLYVAMLPETSARCAITAIGYSDYSMGETSSFHEALINSVTLEAGKFYRNVPVTLVGEVGKYLDLSEGSIIAEDGDYIFQSGNGINSTGNNITIEDGATVIIENVKIWTGLTDYSAGIICNGTATIKLLGTNTVWGEPGIQAGPAGTTLTICGDGSLTAISSGRGAGIGGGDNMAAGNIRIEGGSIMAYGGYRSAAIGSGMASNSNASCGDITITGGTVEATGGEYAAGIGSGYTGNGHSSCGDITITGGTVTATGGKEDGGAGIGTGYHGTCANITISGGTVEATGGENGAGIGSGYDGNCAHITISGGTVEATGIGNAAGIGCGYYGDCGNIDITHTVTSVTATRGTDACYSIGIGDIGSCGEITIGGVYFHSEDFYNRTFTYKP